MTKPIERLEGIFVWDSEENASYVAPHSKEIVDKINELVDLSNTMAEQHDKLVDIIKKMLPDIYLPTQD